MRAEKGVAGAASVSEYPPPFPEIEPALPKIADVARMFDGMSKGEGLSVMMARLAYMKEKINSARRMGMKVDALRLAYRAHLRNLMARHGKVILRSPSVKKLQLRRAHFEGIKSKSVRLVYNEAWSKLWDRAYKQSSRVK